VGRVGFFFRVGTWVMCAVCHVGVCTFLVWGDLDGSGSFWVLLVSVLRWEAGLVFVLARLCLLIMLGFDEMRAYQLQGQSSGRLEAAPIGFARAHDPFSIYFQSYLSGKFSKMGLFSCSWFFWLLIAWDCTVRLMESSPGDIFRSISASLCMSWVWCNLKILKAMAKYPSQPYCI
jgi:hypothetical protein